MSRNRIFRIFVAGVCAAVFGAAVFAPLSPVRGDVAILLNRTDRDISYHCADRVRRDLAPGEAAPMAFDGGGLIEFRSNQKVISRRLEPNRIYMFAPVRGGGVDLQRLSLSSEVAEEVLLPSPSVKHEAVVANKAPPGSGKPAPGATGVVVPPATSGHGTSGHASTIPSPATPIAARRVVIPVKILVDEDEAATRAIWEKRLRRRVAAASEILKRCCFVELEVVAVDQWNSQNDVTDFNQSLREFEREVSPGAARLAIGFTSQFQMPKGRTHMGGTRAMLHSHILMREWSRVASEPERLEILLHELGHFLGAAHSAESQSVMRTLLADRKSLARAFRIQFDPLNMLAMNLVAEELGRNINVRPADISLPTQFELCKLYAEISRALPGDPAAAEMEDLLERSGMMPRMAAAQWVLRAVTAAAEENSRRPAPGTGSSEGSERRVGDALCEFYIARAADAARGAPPKLAAAGFTIGLAVALDRSTWLRKQPLVGPLCERLEPARARAVRLQLLGEPTAFGREDLPQHFFISAGLATLLGPSAAESAGLWKEQSDAKTSSGFSMIDYQTDLAGIALAEALRAGSQPLPTASKPFLWRDFLPMAEELPEGLDAAKFAERYGSLLDKRFLKERRGIRLRIEQLPAYSKSVATPKAP